MNVRNVRPWLAEEQGDGQEIAVPLASPQRQLVFKELGGIGKIGEPQFFDQQPIGREQFENFPGIVSAQLVGNEGFVGIMSDGDRQHDSITFSINQDKKPSRPIIGGVFKKSSAFRRFGGADTLFTCHKQTSTLLSFSRETKKSRSCGKMPILGLTQNA